MRGMHERQSLMSSSERPRVSSPSTRMVTTTASSTVSFLTQKIGKFINTKGRAFFGIGFLVALIDAAVANNTVAIVISAPVAKKISEEYKISPIQAASILDISSCIVQGIIPYGAQVFLLIKLLGTDVNYSSMIAQSFYIWLLLLCMIVFFLKGAKSKE